MSLRLLLLMKIAVLLWATIYSVSGDVKRSDNGTDLHLVVGKEVMIPEIEEESEKEQENGAKQKPSTDVKPFREETVDTQDHDKKGKNIENGMPPKYPLKAESAETSAHDNEIGGCRDHPRAGLVCSKCENGNKCFPAEHESYTYSYCRRSCRHCDPSTSSFHTFWRLRAQSEFEPTWMLQQVEFYADPQEKISLVDDPEKAYASSVYTGYKPSFGFDNNNATAWYPSGWGSHDNNDDWIAYEFTVAVRVHGVRMVVDNDHATAQPKKVVVEASDKMYGPFSKKWTIYNTDFSVDKIYKLLECDVLWRRLEVEDGAWCFRLIAKLETWEGARKSCEIEGGDLATIINKEEQRFITDEVGLCSHTWFGLSHTNQGYYWNDGSNSTYRNWKDQLTYSDVQKQTLNCAAMDPDGVWFNFHCSNKFYFLCKKRLVPRADPRPDLTDNAWPYPPEVPPLIFFAPNVTVPVINSKNLEPGIFPDANGKVEGEEEEDITLSDLFYEQTVEHLKEKGLKPSEEIEADENQEETDFTQELNKIAINTSPGDYQNETKGDTTTNNTATAHKQEQDFENIPNKEANNAETAGASADAPKPKPKHKEKPVPPPPEEGDSHADDNSYPEIKHGKPIEDSVKNKSRPGKKVPKASPDEGNTLLSSETGEMPSYMSLYPGRDIGHEAAHKAGDIANKNREHRRKKKPVHQNEENGPHDKDKSGQSGQQTKNSSQGMYFYVPNTSGSYTLMRTIYPWGPNNYTRNGQQAQLGNPSDAKQKQEKGETDVSQRISPYMPLSGAHDQPQKAENIGQQDEQEGKEKVVSPNGQNQQGMSQQGQQTQNSTYKQQYFYVPNSSGTMTLMKTINPTNNYTANGNMATAGAQAQPGDPSAVKQKQEKADESEHISPYMPLKSGQNKNMHEHAHDQAQKAEDIGQQDEEEGKEKVAPQNEQSTSQQGQQTNLLQNSTYKQQYFYVPNTSGTMTLMRTAYPTNNYTASGNTATAGAQALPGNPSDVKQKQEKGETVESAINAINMPLNSGQNMNMHEHAHDQPQKSEDIGQQDEEEGKEKVVSQNGESGQGTSQQGQQTSLTQNSTDKPQYFYVPNTSGTMTLMRTTTNYTTNGNMGTAGAQAQPGNPSDVKQNQQKGATNGYQQTTSYMPLNPGQNMYNGQNNEQPQKAENIDKQDEEEGSSDKSEQSTTQQAQQNSTQQQSTYFYMPNSNGTYTLMRSVSPNNYSGQQAQPGSNGSPQTADPPQPKRPRPKRPKPKEGDRDDDSDDSIEEPPDIKKKKRKGESFKNKEIPMNPFTGPLAGPSLAQQNISKSARRKIKILHPLESAAQGEDYSIHPALSRANIHSAKDKFSAKKRKRNKHLNHLNHIKEHDKATLHSNDDSEESNAANSRFGFPKEDDDNEFDESGSGSGTQVEETDNADIFPDSEEEFWSR